MLEHSQHNGAKADSKAIYVEQVVILEGRSWSTQTD
jgi:hypothetical protein